MGAKTVSTEATTCIEVVGVPRLPLQLEDPIARELAACGVDLDVAKMTVRDNPGASLMDCLVAIYSSVGLLTPANKSPTVDKGESVSTAIEARFETRADEAEVLLAMFEDTFEVRVAGELWVLDTGLVPPGTAHPSDVTETQWSRPLCEFFVKGCCRYAANPEKCKFSHSMEQLAAERAAAAAAASPTDGGLGHSIYDKLRGAEMAKRLDSRSLLEVRFPASSLYPDEPPLLLFRNASLSPQMQMSVTMGLMREAATYAADGEPCVYNLLLWLQSGAFEELLASPDQALLGKAAGEFSADSTCATLKVVTDVIGKNTAGSEAAVSPTSDKSANIVAEKEPAKTFERAMDPPTLKVGLSVRVCGLVGAPQFNGRAGIIHGFSDEHGRYQIVLDESQEMLLCRPKNIEICNPINPDIEVEINPIIDEQTDSVLLREAPAECNFPNVSDREDKTTSRPSINEGWARIESVRMQTALQKMQRSAKLAPIQAKRKALPSFGYVDNIIKCLQESQAVVICGSTGCGKTTQIPQFILDSWIEAGNGAACSIVCTQPRRISAISVAERVAAERGEKIGESVGYQIRLEKEMSPKTRCLFCTTGILLRKLEQDKNLYEYSHVIVDEVHERSVESDFLLMILRDLITTRTDIRIIMMSATVNAALFSDYFGGVDKCPIINIPGKAFAVQSYFLEDAVEMTGFKADSAQGGSQKPAKPKYPVPKSELAELRKHYSRDTVEQLTLMDLEEVNVELIISLLEWICAPAQQAANPGAVLVFLPGLANITACYEELDGHPAFPSEVRNGGRTDRSQHGASGDGGATLHRYRIVPLHSSLSSDDQKIVFSRPPDGVTKIVLATNIAETSVTIDDIVWVIDSCRMKETQYDPGSKMAALVETWVSKANAVQRRGRAGRIQPGQCFHLVTKRKFDGFEPQQEPEMHRVPLEQLCLHIKVLPGLEAVDAVAQPARGKSGRKASPYIGVMSVLARVIQPPKMKAVLSAKSTLTQMNAFDAAEKLTPLGHHLARLPVDCRMAKLLVLGAVFGCLDATCTLAAALASHSPFVSPIDKRDEADTMRRAWAVEASDHLTLLRVYNAWAALGPQQRRQWQFCRENFLSFSTMRSIREQKLQFACLLADIGFAGSNGLSMRDIAAAARKHVRDTDEWTDGVRAALPAELNNNESTKVLKALLCAALFPNVASAIGRDPVAFSTKKDGKIAPHPSSVNSGLARAPSPYFVYLAKVKTAQIYLRDSTSIGLYPLLLFGDQLTRTGAKIAIGKESILCDAGSAELAALVVELRDRLEQLLAEKIQNPSLDVVNSPVIRAIVDFVESETL